MNQKEKRQLETATFMEGLKSAANLEAIRQLRLIDSHEVLAALLNECPRANRAEMLESVRAYLPFEAHESVDKYEAMNAAKFRDWEERRRQMIEQCSDAVDEMVRKHGCAAVVELKCYKCSRTRSYAGETPMSAIILGRQDGWIRDRAVNKEVCPKCECADRGKRKKCPGCSRRHYAPDCRVLGKIEPGAPLIGGAEENVTRLN